MGIKNNQRGALHSRRVLFGHTLKLPLCGIRITVREELLQQEIHTFAIENHHRFDWRSEKNQKNYEKETNWEGSNIGHFTSAHKCRRVIQLRTRQFGECTHILSHVFFFASGKCDTDRRAVLWKPDILPTRNCRFCTFLGTKYRLAFLAKFFAPSALNNRKKQFNC